VIRVNAQSGKGGVAYLLKQERHLELPRRLQIEFSKVVQVEADTTGHEMTSDIIWRIFEDEYLPAANDQQQWGRFALLGSRSTSSDAGPDTLEADVTDNGHKVTIEGSGNGPVAAFVAALHTRDMDVEVLDYHEHAMSGGGDATAAAYVECQIGDDILWGVGIDPSITTATLKAIMSAVNRSQR
jgi:2-isopropylmalate synthase